jgi:hypothetical protein
VGEIVRVTDVLLNNTRKEIVRVFFSLLFLYARTFIDIWMEEDGIILLKMLEPPKSKEKGKEVKPEIKR